MVKDREIIIADCNSRCGRCQVVNDLEEILRSIQNYCNYMTAFNNANHCNKGLDIEEVQDLLKGWKRNDT